MRRALFALLPLLLLSCEKNINIQPANTAALLVIEGKIEEGSYPHVVLSHTMNYFNTLAPTLLENSFVHDARITITDNNKTFDLKEYSLDTLGASIYYYTVDSSQLAQASVGKRGHTYNMQLETAGKTYSASTTIPSSVITIDSVWYKRILYEDDSNYAELRVRITDPPESGNFARYFTKRNSESFFPGLNSTLNDELVNGGPSNMTLDRGPNRNQKIDASTYAFFRMGDTVTVKFCNIDRPTYNFWRTLDFAFSSNGNPFSSPIVIDGNIDGAQGYWGGYTVMYASIIMSN